MPVFSKFGLKTGPSVKNGKHIVIDGVADGFEAFCLARLVEEIGERGPVLYIVRDGQRIADERRSDARAIAQGDEDTSFVSYFIAHTDTGLTESEDFPEAARGMSFTFGAKTSTSGRLMPEYAIRENTGEAPEEFFDRVGFSGDHSQTLRLVASGAWQVGALNYAVYDQAVADNAPEVETAKVIWKTPPYPDYNWTIRGDVDARWGEGFADKVQAALVGMDDPDLLAAFPRNAFIPAANEDYAPIEQVARDLDLLE